MQVKGFEPVSYTHLDVYKRQTLGSFQKVSFMGTMTVSEILAAVSIISVSYTHLDVYKRQPLNQNTPYI